MGRIFVRRADAVAYTVLKDDTLTIILEKAKVHVADLTLSELEIYNWATDEAREVNRALIELIGCSEVNVDPALSKLDPAFGPNEVEKKVYLPKLWKSDDLAIEKTHTITIKQRLPAPAVSITTLDKWFIPAAETCDVKYDLEGIKERASKLDFEVYASNYCKATVEAEGDLIKCTYEASTVPVFEKKIADPVERTAATAVPEWKGESKASEGILKPRTEESKRYVNVACSPYTTLLRYYQNDEDKKARITLDAFWPKFNDADAVVAASLKFKWKVENGGKLKHGQLVVWDKTDKAVYRKGLSQDEIAGGTFDWGVAGKDIVKKDKMPYRVQLQAHSGMDEDEGLALAVMHTEVRLYVHPEVGKYDVADDKNHRKVPLLDEQCLEFSLAGFLPEAIKKKVVKDSPKWCNLRLAELGFHPGPVKGDFDVESFKLALREFQRSYPKKAKDGEGFHQRIAVAGAVVAAVDADTKAQLNGKAVKSLPMFGTINGVENYTPSDLEAPDKINAFLTKRGDTKDLDKDMKDGESLIVWADDRHSYTAGVMPATGDPNLNLRNYRTGMSQDGDGKVTHDRNSIPRPWLPLKVRPRLLSKAQDLTHSTLPDFKPEMLAAIGPLRVDWTFSEVKEDLNLIKKMYDATGVNTPKRVRAKTFVKKTVEHLHKKSGDRHYFNCPVGNGGLRPDDVADYYKELFGVGDMSLSPWKALDDDATKTICSVFHDDLGQAAELLHQDCIGQAGVYFNPSRIAGDGYRVRAQISFAPLPGGKDLPNRSVLKDRYADFNLPQAHTCRMRIWRKTSHRAYVLWANESKKHDWLVVAEKAKLYYRACYLALTHEQDRTSSRRYKAIPLSALLKADDPAFAGTLASYVQKAGYPAKADAKLDFNYTWPWHHKDHFGITHVPDDTVKIEAYDKDFLDNFFYDSWFKFNDILLALLVDRIEKRLGLYRGHTTVEYKSSPEYYKQVYYCNAPAQHPNILLEKNDTGGTATGKACKITGCGGRLVEGVENTYTCPVCNEVKPGVYEPPGTPIPLCKGMCAGTMNLPAGQSWDDFNQGDPVDFECGVCHRTENAGEYYNYQIPAYECGEPCGGRDAGTRLVRAQTGKYIKEGMYSGLMLRGVGAALGASFVYIKNHEVWTHEIGHNRHMEHSASAPGAKNAQHDNAANAALITAKDPKDRAWDSCCTMSYSDEKTFFCGKCILKIRGWKVEGLRAVDAALEDA